MGVCFLDIRIMLHLAALKLIPHFEPQFSSKFRSFCRAIWSCLFLISLSLYTRQSSVKSLTLEEITDGRSLMCSKNKIGPKTVPCGTPESTVTRSDCIPSTTTRCLRCFRKLEIHNQILSSMP